LLLLVGRTANLYVAISAFGKVVEQLIGAHFGTWLDRVAHKRDKAIAGVVADATETHTT